jgi:hypothetical protein
MAPLTSDDLRHPPGADVDTSAGGYAHGATKGTGELPVRHLVIFHTPVLGAAPIRPDA